MYMFVKDIDLYFCCDGFDQFWHTDEVVFTLIFLEMFV